MTTTDSNTAAGKLVAVAKALRAGQTHTQVAQELGLTEDQVRDLARDIPGLTTAPRPTPAIPLHAPASAIPSASPPPRTLVGSSPGTTVPGETPTGPVTIARLLEEASVHSSPAVRRAADHIEAKIQQLRDQMKDLAAAEAAKQAAAAATAKAKADVARLEAELKAARAKLKKQPNPSGRILTPEQKAAAAANLAKARTNVDCPTCGRTFGHAGALGNHKRTCTATPREARP